MAQENEALPPDFRRNFFAFLADGASFRAAFTFVSPYSVLPAFVRQLTTSAPLIGLVGTIFNGGWLLPQLVTAHLVQDKPRKKPTMLAGLSGRVLFLVIALALWAGLSRHPPAMLALFFLCLGLFSVSDGVLIVAWFDILARAIPLQRRGRMIGTAQVISGLAGAGVGDLGEAGPA